MTDEMIEAVEQPEPKEKKPSDRKVVVRLLNTDVHDGCYLVVDEDNNGYLVPTEELEFSLLNQTIKESVLRKCVRPYDWTSEIQNLIPTVETIRLALWRNGMLSMDDLGDRRKVRTALYGAFPRKF